jgi:hypothetical protein
MKYQLIPDDSATDTVRKPIFNLAGSSGETLEVTTLGIVRACENRSRSVTTRYGTLKQLSIRWRQDAATATRINHL